METQVPHSSWGLGRLLLLSDRPFAEKKLLQMDGLKPVQRSKQRKLSSQRAHLHAFMHSEKETHTLWWSRWSSPDVTLRYTSNIALYRLLSIYEAFKIILYVSISRWCVLRIFHILCTQGKQFFPQLHGNYWLTNHRKRLKQTWFSNQWRKVSLYPHIADKQLLPDTTNI